MATTTPKLTMTHVESGQNQPEVKVNDALNLLDILVGAPILDRDLTAPPGSPSDGDMYIPLATATGDWVGKESNLAFYMAGWRFVVPVEGMIFWLADEDTLIRYTGAAWSVFRRDSLSPAITASTTQTQGQQPLVSAINYVSTVANVNDTVTLPSLEAGIPCLVVNGGANTLRVFPASGDAVDALAANTSTTVAAGKATLFTGITTSLWRTLVGA